jgi:hypothetical protein
MPIGKTNLLGCVFAIVVTIGISLIIYDLLFSKPDHLNGVISEKIFVPAKTATGATPYGGVRRGNYSITAQQDEQWIAIVMMENGDLVSVHCHADHYQSKNVGDIIHFKKYEGKLFHIKFFAHNEEED